MDEPFRKDMLDRSRRDRPLYLQVYEILRSHALNAAPDSGNVLPSTGRLADGLKSVRADVQTLAFSQLAQRAQIAMTRSK